MCYNGVNFGKSRNTYWGGQKPELGRKRQWLIPTTI